MLATLVVLCLPPADALAYTLYGYEDEYGIVQLSETKASDRHVLLFEGPGDPKLGFAEIKKRIREKGGVASQQRTDWIAGAVKPFGAVPFAGSGRPMAFGPVVTTGPIFELLARYARQHNVPVELLYAVAEQESGFQSGAVSPKGAQGLMQLMPDTQTTMGVTDPFDPEKSVAAGARFLRMMLDRFKETHLALAAYNAGPEVVARSGGVPAIPETVAYVERILARQAMVREALAVAGEAEKPSPPVRPKGKAGPLRRK
ncbi:MAG: lytic transglycosylase domain-containing protein [Desulfovibrionaceae bacterium]|nr:lytic transglycosylase domain-containing protein [Desulfovibrionaceae bacterium]